MSEFKIETLDWDKMSDLIPAVIQDWATARVLMLGYVSQDALEETLEHKKVTFYSRSKQRLWQKGESSGNTLELVEVVADCDKDSVLMLVRPKGPTCHLGTISCFDDASKPPLTVLGELEQRIQERKTVDANTSYTAKLLQGPRKRAAQKVGEEGVEVALAATIDDKIECQNESADLLYHLLVLLTHTDVKFAEVLRVLAERGK